MPNFTTKRIMSKEKGNENRHFYLFCDFKSKKPLLTIYSLSIESNEVIQVLRFSHNKDKDVVIKFALLNSVELNEKAITVEKQDTVIYISDKTVEFPQIKERINLITNVINFNSTPITIYALIKTNNNDDCLCSIETRELDNQVICSILRYKDVLEKDLYAVYDCLGQLKRYIAKAKASFNPYVILIFVSYILLLQIQDAKF